MALTEPEAYLAKASIGSKDQVNQPFAEEVVAALAALDFVNTVQDPKDANTVRVLRRRIHGGGRLLAKDLPRNEAFSQNMGCLLNLAAFFLRTRGSDPGECRQGLWRYLTDVAKPDSKGADAAVAAAWFKDLARAGWFDTLLNDWIEGLSGETEGARKIKEVEARAKRAKRLELLVKAVEPDAAKGIYLMRTPLRHIAEYFGRLILWAGAGLRGREVGVIRFDTDARELGQCVSFTTPFAV